MHSNKQVAAVMLECNYTAIVAACKWYPVSMLELLEPLLVNMHPNCLVLKKIGGRVSVVKIIPLACKRVRHGPGCNS